jgi:polyisoprenoid-binding protein YceI
MKYWTIFAFVLILVLSACASPAATTPVDSEPAPATSAPPAEDAYPAPQATQPAEAYPVPAAENSATAANPETYPASEDTAPAAGLVVFKIVPAESSLGYEVGETFISDNNRFATAVGVTSEINGEIRIDPTNPQNSGFGPITADISKFKSDSDRRDNKIRNDFLESAKYPLVTFTSTEIIGLPENPQPGESYTFQVVGDTTIRETTLPLTFDVNVTVTEAQVEGTATTTFLMSDFGFGPISLVGMLNTEDEVKINFAFVARP